jgi:hypothetical protein
MDISSSLPSARKYLRVSAQEDDDGDIYFNVKPLSPLANIADRNFGIQ